MLIANKIDLGQLERDERFGSVVNMLRAYRRNAADYHAHHEKLKGDEGCVCRRCQEYERMERLWPQYIAKEHVDG